MKLSDVTQVDPWKAVAWTTKTWTYRNVSMRAFVLEMDRKYDLGVKSVSCIPEQTTVTALINYNDPVEKVFDYISEAGLTMYKSNDLISFCGPELDPGRLRYRYRVSDSLDLMDVLHGGERLAWADMKK